MSKLPSISSLMSPPPQTLLESFSRNSPCSKSTPPPPSYIIENTLPPIQSTPCPETKVSRILPSPPISPWTGHVDKMPEPTTNNTTAVYESSASIRDPVLYPDTEAATAIEQPLFPSNTASASPEHVNVFDKLSQDEFTEHLQLIDQHIASNHLQFRGKKPPSREDYLLAISCVSKIGKLYNENPGAYMRRAREETEEHWYKAKRIGAKPGVSVTRNVKIAPAPAPSSAQAAVRQPRKPATPVKRKATTIIKDGVEAKVPFKRQRRTPKPSPKIGLLDGLHLGPLAAPEAKSPAMKRDDVDYNALPDFTPPLSTLPTGNPKLMKIDWPATNALNLSNDPDRHLLHEAEIGLASTLRLSCATYLCSKRRIFEARLRAYKIGKEFRKTDAQQACKIDVNKASKLWTAYEKVGWFKKEHLQPFL